MSEPRGHYLDVEPRRAVTMRGARRRAWMARWSRILFLIALVAIGLPVAWYLLRPDPAAVEPELAPVEAAEAGVQRVTAPRLTGFDTAGRPFEVLAETAIRRQDAGANTLELEEPCFYDNEAEDPAGRTQVCARGGFYDSENKILDLEVDVNLQTPDGYTFTTSHARIFIDERRAEGHEPVQGSSASGTVTADRWSYAEDGAILHFEGNVRTVFEDEAGDAAAEDAVQ